MQRLSEHVNLTPEAHSSDSSNRSDEAAGIWVEVWRAGTLVFGEKWLRKHGERPGGEWSQVFLNLTDQQIRRGIRNMRQDAEAKIRANDEAWPPIAFEFACLCKRTSALHFPDNMPPEHEQQRLAKITPYDGWPYGDCIAHIRRRLRGC